MNTQRNGWRATPYPNPWRLRQSYQMVRVRYTSKLSRSNLILYPGTIRESKSQRGTHRTWSSNKTKHSLWLAQPLDLDLDNVFYRMIRFLFLILAPLFLTKLIRTYWGGEDGRSGETIVCLTSRSSYAYALPEMEKTQVALRILPDTHRDRRVRLP